MKRQISLVFILIAFSCFTNKAIAQVVTKKKTAATTVKKSTVISKKGATSTPQKTTPTASVAKTAPASFPAASSTSGGYKCKVTKTTGGCTIVFEQDLSAIPSGDRAKVGAGYLRKEYMVSYKDNAVREVSSIAPNEKPIIKPAALSVEENQNEGNVTVAIKDLSVVFDVLKDKKELPVINGAATFPDKLPDGVYVTKVNWNWDMPIGRDNTNCTLTFKVEVKGGSVVSIF